MLLSWAVYTWNVGLLLDTAMSYYVAKIVAVPAAPYGASLSLERIKFHVHISFNVLPWLPSTHSYIFYIFVGHLSLFTIFLGFPRGFRLSVLQICGLISFGHSSVSFFCLPYHSCGQFGGLLGTIIVYVTHSWM
jgi:hypothetical protein